MAYDELLTKQDFIEQLSLEAKIWKLDRDTYRGPEDIKNWKSAFMYGFEPAEREFIREQRIIWRANDILFLMDSKCPRYGIAGNIAQLQYFINDDRIHRDEIGIELEIWNEILELDEVILGESDENLESHSTDDDTPRSEGLHIDDFDSTLEVSSELKTDETDRPATPSRILDALDKIVTYLTGRCYSTHTAVGAKYGAYINSYDFNVNVMASFWDKGNAFLPDQLEKVFQSGDITSWNILIKELEYFFDCDESTETMIDLFADLTSIAMNSDFPTKMKFSQMKIKISQFFRTKPDDFLNCRDSHYLYSRQTKCEEYGPMIHTLLTCMIYMASPLAKSEWKKVHDEYFRFLKKSPSYKDWHENRWHFNSFMDLKLKEENGIDPNLNDKCNKKLIRDTRLNDVNEYSTYDNGAKNNNFGNSSRCNQNQNMIGQFRANNENFDPKLKLYIEKPRNTNSQNFNPHTQNCNPHTQNFNSHTQNCNPHTQNFNPHTQNNLMNETSRWNNMQKNGNFLNDIPKCSHCTRLYGKTVKHNGPYQGRGEKCLYDTNGRMKPRNDRFEYSDNRRTLYIFEKIVKEINSVQRFEQSRTRAVNVKKVSKTVEERGFLPHYMKLSKKAEQTPKKVETVPENMTKGSRDEVTHMTRRSRDDVTQLSNDKSMNFRKWRLNGIHRDENFIRSTDKSRNKGMKLGQNLNEGKPAEIPTLNESHRDDRNFMTRKRKCIDWNPYLKCRFLNPNIPTKDRFGTLKLDSGACHSLINESLLKFCRILKKEKSYDNNVYGADGSRLSLADYTVDIEIEIENLGFFILRKVLVSTTPTSAFRKSFLLGLSDLNRLKIDMDFRTKRVRFGVGPNAGKWIKMKNYL